MALANHNSIFHKIPIQITHLIILDPHSQRINSPEPERSLLGNPLHTMNMSVGADMAGRHDSSESSRRQTSSSGMKSWR